MNRVALTLLLGLAPVTAHAGAQYTAEEIIRFFEQANAASDASRIERPRPPGVPVNRPASPRAAAVEAPLAIPYTGVKAGHRVPAAGGAAPEVGNYDLLVTFEHGSARLTSQARQNLDSFARALANPALASTRFAVEGHTDSTGPADHNLELSRRRAASVVDYLVARGVRPDRLTATGYGEARPRSADPTGPANRRVETRRLP